MAVQIQWRRDTAANWTAANPLLAQGEAGLETDTGRFKMGDGATLWVALAYFTDQTGIGALSAGTQSVSTGTMIFANSNGVTFGMSGSSQITASVDVGAFNAGVSTDGNTAGDTGMVSSRMVLVGGNNITLSGNTGVLNRMTVTIEGQQFAFSADASSTFKTLTFQDSNGISFSNNAGALRITHGLQYTSATSAITSAALHTSSPRINVSAGTASNNLSALTFADLNGVSFGLDGSTITASVLGAGAAAFNAGISTGGNTAGDTGMVSSRVVFVGGDNITLSGNTGALNRATISIVGPSTTGLLSNINVSAGTTSQNLSALTFSNGSGVSFGLNGSVITASVAAAGGAQTGISGLANSETTYTSGSVTFSALGALTIRSTTGQQFQFSVNAQSVVPGIQTIAFANTTFTTGAVSFSNANGISFGSSGAQVTASYTVPTQSAQTVGVYGSSQTTGQSSSSTVDARSITFRGAGIVSVGLSAGEVIISATGGAGGVTPALSGSNGSFTFSTATLGDLNGASFYTSNGSMVVSYTVPSVAGLISAINVSAGTTSGNLSALTFGNANGISFGLNASTVTASHNGLTTQSGQAFSADASSTFQTLTFQDSNGVSFSNNAGALRITHALQFTSATSAITSAALHTSASRVINIVAATNNTGGGTASLSSNVSFSAANGITFYTSAGNAIVGSHNAITTGRASTDAIGLATAQTNVTWTANSAGLSFNAAGYGGTTTAITGGALLTLNSLGLRLDGAGLAGTSTGFAGANISGSMTHNSAGLNLSLSVAAPGGGGMGISAGTQSVSTGTMIFANSNGLTFGMSGSSQITMSYNSTQFAGLGTTFQGNNASGSMTLNSNGLNLSVSVAAPGAAAENNWVHLLGANTAGNTTASGSTVGFSGINMTLSGTNASQVVFSVPATSSLVGTSGISVSTAGSTISVYNPVALSRFLFEPPGASSAGSAITQGSMSFQRVVVPANMSFSRVDVPFGLSLGSSATTNTGNLLVSSGLVIYSISGTSTLNPIVGAFGTTTYTWASNTSNFAFLSGQRFFSFPVATLLTPGEYYIGIQLSTNNNSSIGASTTQYGNTISLQHGAIYTASAWQQMGVSSATSINIKSFVGVAASVTATGQTQQLSNITQTGTALMRANYPVLFRNY